MAPSLPQTLHEQLPWTHRHLKAAWAPEAVQQLWAALPSPTAPALVSHLRVQEDLPSVLLRDLVAIDLATWGGASSGVTRFNLPQLMDHPSLPADALRMPRFLHWKHTEHGVSFSGHLGLDDALVLLDDVQVRYEAASRDHLLPGQLVFQHDAPEHSYRLPLSTSDGELLHTLLPFLGTTSRVHRLRAALSEAHWTVVRDLLQAEIMKVAPRVVPCSHPGQMTVFRQPSGSLRLRWAGSDLLFGAPELLRAPTTAAAHRRQLFPLRTVVLTGPLDAATLPDRLLSVPRTTPVVVGTPRWLPLLQRMGFAHVEEVAPLRSVNVGPQLRLHHQGDATWSLQMGQVRFQIAWTAHPPFNGLVHLQTDGDPEEGPVALTGEAIHQLSLDASTTWAGQDS